MSVNGVGMGLRVFSLKQDALFHFLPSKIDLMPHDLITQLLRVLAIETKQEKAMAHADPTELTLSGLEAFSFDYIVKWPLSLIINRCGSATQALARSSLRFGRSENCATQWPPRPTEDPRRLSPAFSARGIHGLSGGHRADCGAQTPCARCHLSWRPA